MRIEGGDIEALEHVEELWTVDVRAGAEAVVAVGPERLVEDRGGIGCEVRRGEDAVMGAHLGIDGLGDRTVVDRRRTFRGDALKGAGEVGGVETRPRPLPSFPAKDGVGRGLR